MKNSVTSDCSYLQELNQLIKNDITKVFGEAKYNFKEYDGFYNKLSYSLDTGGALKRPLMMYMAYNCIKDTFDEGIKYVAAAIEILHTASLIHDDIIDESSTRRNCDSVYKKFGISEAILLGDFLIFYSEWLISKYKSKKKDVLISKILNKTFQNMCIGQFMEKQLIGNLDINLDIYFKVIRFKTAYFFAAICKIGGILANGKSSQLSLLSDFGLNIGIAYQIRDDLINYMDGSSHESKPIDIDEKNRLVTYPISIAYKLGNKEQKKVLEGFFRLDDTIEPSFLRRILYETGAIEESKQIICRYVEKAISSLNSLESSKAKAELISFCNSIIVC
ncbi:octaprenyl-diphosphate synthase [Ruminiclostridium sufflavum DSM 19573]|uniref:Octaprenyl-diphosphate synthase n=1 Tax=Ruminiclostridium sufflavum DSM 19573 TaxID=1121337 RepID=A0A318Y7D3_9FIRM|nr:polyprenyl synthetase family protein [Ruminiclostridium sufflavum]PYG88031.1 octaprenyl-diphosphate synthase [Ruminiclostridium sufflavum DSM 19573]